MEEDNWENYETGPFCEHWSDPTDCDMICRGCGHKCCYHSVGEYCYKENCECEKFINEEK